MYNAATMMNQLQHRMDQSANNLSNMNTHGYKARQSNFSSLMVQQIDNMLRLDSDSSRLTPEGIRVGSGAKLAHTNILMDQGTIQATDRPLDVAIEHSNQFFVVNAPNANGETEQQYTRAGNFYLQPVNDNEQVMLTDANGNPVEGNDGPIIIDHTFDNIEITADGRLETTTGDQRETVANIQLVQIDLPRTLENVGGGNYRLDAEGLGVPAEEIVTAIPAEAVTLHTRSLEASNVNFAQEMTRMIESQRAYSLNSQSITLGDQMMGLINSMRS
uniref:flagellar hook-basal body protein n=1 Tax=uncultured Allobacillus sp. TaxID=1638025 RepID=UPI0025920940|nr:flagellar hook-basal body protein [uncultured Allobacillus sp.]